MPSFNDDHLGFSGPELNHANVINFTAAGGKSFSMHNPVLFESTATMANLPVDNTVTRAVGVDGSGNLVNTSKVVDADITALTAVVNTKADTSVVTALTAVVATKASSTVVCIGSKASQVEVDSIATTVADKADTSTVTALTTTVGTKADTSTVTALSTTVGTKAAQSALDTLTYTVGTKADASAVKALSTTVGTKADDSAVVKTSGDQAVGGQKTWTGAQINTGGLYGLGTVSFQGTSSKAVAIQSSNPGGGVNSELRLVTADNTDASNITYNTGVVKYNGATSTIEMDKSVEVTGTHTVKHPLSGATVATLNASSGAACQFTSVSASGGITSTTASKTCSAIRSSPGWCR
jgi:hypothetical protein